MRPDMPDDESYKLDKCYITYRKDVTEYDIILRCETIPRSYLRLVDSHFNVEKKEIIIFQRKNKFDISTLFEFNIKNIESDPEPELHSEGK